MMKKPPVGHQLDTNVDRSQGLPPAARSQQLDLQAASEPKISPRPSPVDADECTAVRLRGKAQASTTAVAGVGKPEMESTPSDPHPVGRGLWAARSELQQMMVAGVVKGALGYEEELRVLPERRMLRRMVEMIVVVLFIASGFFIQFVLYSYVTPAYESVNRDFWNELMTVSFSVQAFWIFTSFTTRHLVWVMLPPWVMMLTVEMVNIFLTSEASAVGEQAYRMNAEAGPQTLSALGLLGSLLWVFWLVAGWGKGSPQMCMLRACFVMLCIVVLNFR